jgi:hypothetical protein
MSHQLEELAEQYARAYIEGKDAPEGIKGAFELIRLAGLAKQSEQRASFELQRNNYIDLYNAVVGDGTFAGSPDALQIAKQLRSDHARLERENAELRTALEEIAEGSGAFSRDPLTHAANCIDNMKALARAALANTKGGAA